MTIPSLQYELSRYPLEKPRYWICSFSILGCVSGMVESISSQLPWFASKRWFHWCSWEVLLQGVSCERRGHRRRCPEIPGCPRYGRRIGSVQSSAREILGMTCNDLPRNSYQVKFSGFPIDVVISSMIQLLQ